MDMLAAARAVHLAGLAVIFGGSAYSALLRRAKLCEAPADARHVLFVTAATLALFSAIAWFGLVAGEMSGSWSGSIDPRVLQLAATDTRFGHIFVGRFIGLIALWFVCVFGRRSSSLAMPVVGGLLLLSLAPISHAAASGGDIAVAGASSDAVHLLAAAFWVGALVILALLIRRHWRDAAALAGASRVFSMWGSAAVALLVLSGVVNALSILPVHAMTLRNPYFDLLLVKVGLAVVMVGMAAANRWRFAPALPTGGERAMRYLAVSVGFETGVGFLVIAIAGYLGTMAPH